MFTETDKNKKYCHLQRSWQKTLEKKGGMKKRALEISLVMSFRKKVRETEDPPPDVSLMETLLAQADPLVGVGTRGLRPGHLKCLIQGQFHHEEARQAKVVWEEFGKAYASGRLPRWVIRSLNGGLLTPLVKKPPPGGMKPDVRPTNARDVDVTPPLKAIQRKAGPALLRRLRPQQLGVGAKNGVELKILLISSASTEQMTRPSSSSLSI